MNMKKTLAGLMAGVVAISAMATVAVSAKAQKADEVTWSTMAKETKNAETIVYLTLTAAEWTAAYGDGTPVNIELEGEDAEGDAYTLEVKEITKITFRDAGNTSVIDEDISRFYNLYEDDKDNIEKNEIALITDVPDGTAKAELAIRVEVTNGLDIAKNSIEASTGIATNVKKDASTGKVGVLLNIETDAKTDRSKTILIRNLDGVINDHMNPTNNPLKDIEPTEEIADFLTDAKGATIAFNFEKKDIDDSVSDKEFSAWVDRYDWNADGMKSAISLRINNSNVLSVDMMEFDKANFSAVYSWDEVMAKFQVGSATGLVNQMGLKINNDKLPAQKDDADKVIELRLASITVKIPELAETNDDTMVEDFAAGESATVVEDTLPAATDAPAADAPAATDAPATTDAADNPETGNSAAALLAIPAALAAAAIVAKKRG